MRVLLDTGVLPRYAYRGDPLSAAFRSSVATLGGNGEALHIFTQNLIEVWSVSSRSITVNSQGMSVTDTELTIDHLLLEFNLVPEPAVVFERWRDLPSQYKGSGRQVHDTRLVALMIESGIESILTFNDVDFRWFKEITAIHPTSVPIPKT